MTLGPVLDIHEVSLPFQRQCVCGHSHSPVMLLVSVLTRSDPCGLDFKRAPGQSSVPLTCGVQFTAISRIRTNGPENILCFTSQGSGRNSFWQAGYLPPLNKIISWFEVFLLQPLLWLEEMDWLRAVPAAALGGSSLPRYSSHLCFYFLIEKLLHSTMK